MSTPFQEGASLPRIAVRQNTPRVLLGTRTALVRQTSAAHRFGTADSHAPHWEIVTLTPAHMILKHSSFAAGFSERHVAKLDALGRDVTFNEDQLILPAGQRSTHFYVLLSGSVCVEVRTPVYTICVQVLRPGEAFGWSSLLIHHDTLFQVRAREASAGLCWKGSQLSAMCRENREFGLELYYRLLELVAGRVKATESKLVEFCGAPGLMSPARGV